MSNTDDALHMTLRALIATNHDLIDLASTASTPEVERLALAMLQLSNAIENVAKINNVSSQHD